MGKASLLVYINASKVIKIKVTKVNLSANHSSFEYFIALKI